MRRTLNSLLLPLLLLAVGCTRTASVPKEVTMEKDVLMDKIGRTAVVGGLRINA